MDKKLNKAFEQAIVHLKVSDIIFSKEINKDIFFTRKYAQIVSSVREIGLIEAPIVTFSDNGYTLLDGHLRLNALKDLDIPEVDCLVSTDNENFTYSCNIFDCFVISFSFCYSLSFTTATKPETFL